MPSRERKRRYVCTSCLEDKTKSELYSKTVLFTPLDKRAGGSARKRTIAWICSDCIDKDPHWNQPSYAGPGNIIEKVLND